MLMLSHVGRATALVLLALPAVGTAQTAPTRSISVTGQAEVRVTPSTVNIVFGVETRHKYGGGAPWHSYNDAWSGMRYGGAGMNQVSVQGGGNTGELSGDAIALGQIGITASVSVSFELEPQ
jgi:uncharacterized protein YggE